MARSALRTHGGTTGYLRWLWEVRPERAGDMNLLLNVRVVLPDATGETRLRTLPFRPTRVRVQRSTPYSIAQFIERHEATLFGRVALPILIASVTWLAARFRRPEAVAPDGFV